MDHRADVGQGYRVGHPALGLQPAKQMAPDAQREIGRIVAAQIAGHRIADRPVAIEPPVLGRGRQWQHERESHDYHSPPGHLALRRSWIILSILPPRRSSMAPTS